MMRIVPVDATSPDPAALEEAASILSSGGIVAFPTETVYGLGADAGNDGIALDEHGRVYVAANAQGKIWRVDPRTGEITLIAENMPGAASIAFGEGSFDRQSIYVTSTRTGRVWRVEVGARGLPLHR